VSEDRASEWDLPREQAVPRLVDRFGGRLWGIARQLCGNADEADDLVQEVFLRAWRKWSQFDGRADPMPWLYTIANRACQRLHRRRAGQPAKIESLDETNAFGKPRIASLPADDDAFLQQVRRENREAVGSAITALPDGFRMPLVLKDIVGFSIEEVAAILGLKDATVKTRVHRARLRLRDALERGLPQAEVPPPVYSRQVCLDLLRAKQESLDRGVEMPDAERILCERCRAVFATLDLTQDICRDLGATELPPRLREHLVRALSRKAS
jgi:RNA polymerase sigma-70 factor (ECF subfamily)